MEDLEKDLKRAEWAREREERAKKNEENTLEVLGPGEGYQKLFWIWEGAGRDPNQDDEGEHFVMFYLISYYSKILPPFTCGGQNHNHMQTSGMKKLCC